MNVGVVFMEWEISGLEWVNWLDRVSMRVREAALRPRVDDAGQEEV